ncbi:MAG: hypothetical protein H7Z14_00030 [Anaerolineae bacterium]|nr:hypothetical protein [Phycisphaerae bacterium]
MMLCKTFGQRLVRDERGTEVLEYALMLGMIVCACIALVSALGVKVVARWTRVTELL